MSKVLIAVPTYENIYPDTFKSIYQMDCGEHETDFDFIRGYDVASARNRIAQATLDGGYDFVLTVDSDEVVPRDTLINLMESQKEEHGVVVGYSLSRPHGAANTSGRTTAFKFKVGFGRRDYTVDSAYTGEELEKIRSNGLNKLQIRGTGLACALIHKSVFERMSFPWFKWTQYSSGSQLSEDLFFCEKLKRIAVPIFVDTRVKCGHIMRHIEYPNEQGGSINA